MVGVPRHSLNIRSKPYILYLASNYPRCIWLVYDVVFDSIGILALDSELEVIKIWSFEQIKVQISN